MVLIKGLLVWHIYEQLKTILFSFKTFDFYSTWKIAQIAKIGGGFKNLLKFET